jgi:hypothetical protein
MPASAMTIALYRPTSGTTCDLAWSVVVTGVRHAVRALAWPAAVGSTNGRRPAGGPEATRHWTHFVLLFALLATSVYAVLGRSKLAVLLLFAVWFYLDAMGVVVPNASAVTSLD